MGSPWSVAYFASTLAMWVVMMTVMMLPSAMPMLRVVAATSRQAVAAGGQASPPIITTLGYLTAWLGFSIGATLLQMVLLDRARLSPGLVLLDRRLAAILLIGAGAYQLTPIKSACLVRCRSPFSVMLHGWRDGARGALLMGMEQGVYCVACCWAMMLVLFVAGVMNPYAIALLGTLVALEKLAHSERWPRWLLGVGLLAWGVLMVVAQV